MTLTLENSSSPRWVDLVQTGPAGSAEASPFQIYVAAFYFCSLDPKRLLAGCMPPGLSA